MPAALVLEPDLVSVHVGVNDLMNPRLDVATYEQQMGDLLAALAPGRRVLATTIPPVFDVVPAPRPYRRFVEGRRRSLNTAIHNAAEAQSVLLLDVAELPEGRDPRYWAQDRLHPNAYGHELLARQALAVLEGRDPHAVVLEAPDMAFTNWRWVREHLAPWVVRGLIGTREEHPAKHPTYERLTAGSDPR